MFPLSWSLLVFLPPLFFGLPIEDVHILEKVKVTNYSGPLNEHSIGTYFDRVGNLRIQNSNILDLSKYTLKLFSKLENLTITNSNIQASEEDIFVGCCPTLRNLKVNNWQNFNEDDLKGIGTLPLETLSIRNQNLTQIGEDILKNANLKSLHLDHNSIKNFSSAVFDDLYQLETLSLSWNDLNEFPKEIMSPLKRLKTLHLETDRFSRFSLVNLTYLPELEEIFLTKKNMKEVNLWGIQEKAPKLRDVYLTGNDGVHTEDSEGPAVHF